MFVKKIQLFNLLSVNLFQRETNIFKLNRLIKTKECFSRCFSEYTNRLVEEINDILSERGLMSMSDLIRQFDLPTDYLQNLVHQRIIGPSSLNNVKFESSTLYTDNYVRLQQNILLGYLQAALLPVRVNELLRSGRINENLVQSKSKISLISRKT